MTGMGHHLWIVVGRRDRPLVHGLLGVASAPSKVHICTHHLRRLDLTTKKEKVILAVNKDGLQKNFEFRIC